MFSLFKSRKNRNKALQIGFVGFLILIVIAFILTARSNLESQGLTPGFDFLDRATGIGLNFSLIPYKSSDTYSRALLIGILNSIFVGAISLTFATFIGIVVGVMRTSRNTMAKLIGTTYVEVFRNIPLLLQLFFWYAILISLPRPTKTTGIFDMFFLTGCVVDGANLFDSDDQRLIERLNENLNSRFTFSNKLRVSNAGLISGVHFFKKSQLP